MKKWILIGVVIVVAILALVRLIKSIVRLTIKLRKIYFLYFTEGGKGVRQEGFIQKILQLEGLIGNSRGTLKKRAELEKLTLKELKKEVEKRISNRKGGQS